MKREPYELRMALCGVCGHVRDAKYQHDPTFECAINGLIQYAAVYASKSADGATKPFVWNKHFHSKMAEMTTHLRTFSNEDASDHR